ncbi:MAG: SHOCT domain-containing protein [Pseudodesulfovibrio sp.]|uniref:SHOCT domain-containing protein n=2 Tax=Pseudodesulfovibrio TaxID=2035811 RepID=E6VVB6_PSEA9|nr:MULTISPECIES: hypothetical protein [Pseudodesulfovibrio]MBU4193221.1 SHOCT domain-containing protein [Pseudomonadota bacterium]ADU62360.1 hypothetical protein Daes_1346 [Pseudodesulfovibrio aespoeensis Aspo-2]MBU4243498.1 SHOCT domain-containing protein [Pseudomonadota bacterium]MBU4377694.1 SHOCT domain-containing protein [Pseudomonadota bacterium]MBU4473976.1 SHOCT domain-containing protein [Pseudomonadota bacterium]
MRMSQLPTLVSDFFDFLDSPVWRAWPFNAGYGEHILPSIARMAFVVLIFAVIIIFLRILFGPNGPLRDKEMDREADEQRATERAALDAQLSRGDITEFEHTLRMKGLKD